MDDKNHTNTVYSVSISARLTLEMHSLNNEGGEGNQIATRMVTLVTPGGDIETVNAVSGDMLKHIQAAHLHRLAGEQGLSLSEGSRMFNPNRINVDIRDATADVKRKGDRDMIDWLLERDAISDMEGILITEGRALGRKSVVEFGWLVGLPDKVRTENFLHTKYVPDSGKGRVSSEQATPTEGEGQAGTGGSNLGQNLFYRPASSGIYALVLNMEPARIGFNDISQSYPINDEDRARRYRALLESVLYTLVQPRGAMRNTQNPHIVDCEGVITWSTRVIPAPTVSPLNDSYAEHIQGIAKAMNGLSGSEVAITVRRFSTLGELGEAIMALRNLQPYHIELPPASADGR